jgi:23S rRNA pseudouridine2605 synthase
MSVDNRNELQNDGQKEPLLKLLVTAGVGSRRKVTALIKQNKIAVNGSIIDSFTFPVNMQKDTITVNDKPLKLIQTHTIVLMMNKPAGILSTTRDERGRTTIIDILPPVYRDMNVYPAGRLDKNSTGLIVLTNDGELTYMLTHPKFEHEKEYLVSLMGILSRDEKTSLEKGIQLEDGFTYPAIVKEVKTYQPYNYSITIHEGRKHQVRRMFEKTGHRVLALKRTRIGQLELGRLEEGKVRELTTGERALLLSRRRE